MPNGINNISAEDLGSLNFNEIIDLYNQYTFETSPEPLPELEEIPDHDQEPDFGTATIADTYEDVFTTGGSWARGNPIYSYTGNIGIGYSAGTSVSYTRRQSVDDVMSMENEEETIPMSEFESLESFE